MTADMTPSSARHLSNMVARQASATGSNESHSSTRSREALTRRAPVIALVALSLLVLAIGGAILKRISDRAQPEPEPVRPVAIKAPPAAPPVLVVDTVPTGARLTIDGQERGTAPQTLEQLGIGSHQISAALEGYQPAARAVELKNAGERVMVELALLPVPVPVPVPEPTPDAGRPVAVKQPVKRPAPPAPTGKLTLKTTPWSTVFLGKRKLGDTPLLNVVLPAGKHTLRLVNPESNLENSIEVEIKANETTVKKLKF